MSYTDEQLDAIFERTDGHCHICGKNLCRNNYGQWGRKGAWEVEHSIPRSDGGSDRLNNLYPAHISCNREKGTVTTRTARNWNGRTRAPLSKEKKENIRSNSRWGWGAAGAISGATIAGPAGFLVGSIIGAVIGDQLETE
jgi:5-methylcytosine-specific restriction endonuclease McrA